MTAHRDLKNRIRERQKKTGESYSAAHAQVMRDRAALIEPGPVPAARKRRGCTPTNELSVVVLIVYWVEEATSRSMLFPTYTRDRFVPASPRAVPPRLRSVNEPLSVPATEISG